MKKKIIKLLQDKKGETIDIVKSNLLNELIKEIKRL